MDRLIELTRPLSSQKNPASSLEGRPRTEHDSCHRLTMGVSCADPTPFGASLSSRRPVQTIDFGADGCTCEKAAQSAAGSNGLRLEQRANRLSRRGQGDDELYNHFMSDAALAHLASPEVLARARKIKLFLMDVDGTLTDGGVCLISSAKADGSGEPLVTEMKVFNAQDGQGLSLAHTMGIQTGFITGRASPAVAKRAEELKATFVYLGQAKKTAAFEECLQKAGVTEEEVAYMGDDLPDIPLAQGAGLAVCVADGAPELKAICHFTTTRLAGRGSAREVVELILKAQGGWEEAVPLALA
jgi:3-deoxy-D-manno-octulosonate 8-phosphate phosphatase (KDO 8-P phosphatase)